MNPAWSVLGWAELRFTGPEPERLLTRLGTAGVPFRDASPPEAFSFSVKIPLRYVKRAGRIASAEGFETEIAARRGLPAAAKKLRTRWWPAAVLSGLLLLLLWSQSYIWYIDVTGNERIPEGVILQALTECGVDIGKRWIGMSQDAVRNGVILRVPGVRWMTVTMQGSRAHVIVREAGEKKEPVPEDEYAEVVADRAGLVTHVYALRGTAEAEAGRFVLPGDPIIGGYATGRFGVQGPVRAVGWAEARAWEEITAAAPTELAVKVPSGDKRVLWSVILGDTRINFSKDSSICPGECDKIIEEYALAVPGVFTLPVTFEKTTIAPYALETVTAEELPEELEAFLHGALLRRVGEDGEIAEETFTVWEAGGLTYVTLEAECVLSIGRTVPLSEAELAAVYAKIPKTAEE